ncbi:MAG TPA: hypothetical protein VFD58_10825 [Blastocatellia bacterium]|nr:hypothetical protein [Blastocatellia bacterium]
MFSMKSKPDVYKRITLSELPPESELGSLYQRLEQRRATLREMQGQLRSLREELENTEIWLRNARYETTTPDEYAKAKAKSELLEKSIAELTPKVGWHGQDTAGTEARLLEEMGRYEQHFKILHDESVRSDDKKRAEQAIRAMISCSESSALAARPEHVPSEDQPRSASLSRPRIITMFLIS